MDRPILGDGDAPPQPSGGQGPPPPQPPPGSAGAGTRARVVVVGSGFGGLACARKLDRTAVDVLLLDQRGYHLFTPLLYQVATALLNPSDIAYPLRSVFRRSRNVRVQLATVRGVDFERQVVHVFGGRDVPYDYLVLATGSTDNYYGNEQVQRVAVGLKVLEDATRLRNHVLACLELADSETDPERRRCLLTFVVVGGGPTGVEYSGALGELVHLVAGRDYPRVRRDEVRIILVEGRERLLTSFSERLGHYAQRVLTRRGIEVRTGVLVKTADERSVTLSDGSVIPACTIAWTGGVRPLVPRAEPDVETTRSRRVGVDPYLRIRGAQRAWAIGDMAAAPDDGGELPMLSAPAMQAGRYVARAVLADLRGEGPSSPFRYFDKGTMATIGRNAGIAQLRGGLELTGFLGWLTWLFVHIWYLIGFRNRIAALLSWAWNYLQFDRPIRIILQTEPDPLVSALEVADPEA